MKPPLLLKNVLDFCFICLAFIYGISIIAGLVLIVTNPDYPIEINDRAFEQLTPSVTAFLLGSLLTSGIFVYVVFLLRKLVRSFFKNKLFTRLQISLFNLIGQLIVLNSVAELVLDFLANLFLDDRLKVEIAFETSYDSFFFKLAVGLFFMYLARLFANAKQLREESELTV